jgi:nicotinamidase-related amidase
MNRPAIRPGVLHLLALVVSLAVAPVSFAQPLQLDLRSLKETAPGQGRYEPIVRPAVWEPAGTAAVVCDMWNQHWCQGATARVAEMAPRMNQVVAELRRRGVLIIHCPSGTLKFYDGTPQRRRAQAAPVVAPRVPLQAWCQLDPAREAPLPIDDADGGCDDEPQCKHPPYPWTRQIATIEIQEGDAITDSAEAYFLMRQRDITNVIVMGVHENMCVLGRPFSIRQLVNQGQNVVLMRDLTDTMYNSRQRPFVNHFVGTDLVAWHIEKHWCPTITSDQVLGGQPFRFAADAPSPRRFEDFAHLFNREGNPVDQYNVVWTTPSRDSSGSMPLGNGDLGINLWQEPEGALLFYLSKTDAWDEKDHLLKLGRVRVTLSPNPFVPGSPFRQELRLRQGEIVIRGGWESNAVTLRLWVDANHPVVRLEAEGTRPLDVQAVLEMWRAAERTLGPDEAS